METERLLTRSLVPDGWHAPRELSMQKEASEYPLHDHQWPTSDEAIRGTTRWFARMDAGGKVSREEMFLPSDDEQMEAYRKEARARWGTTWKKAMCRMQDARFTAFWKNVRPGLAVFMPDALSVYRKRKAAES